MVPRLESPVQLERPAGTQQGPQGQQVQLVLQVVLEVLVQPEQQELGVTEPTGPTGVTGPTGAHAQAVSLIIFSPQPQRIQIQVMVF
jgi:hypothetical protein